MERTGYKIQTTVHDCQTGFFGACNLINSLCKIINLRFRGISKNMQYVNVLVM